MNMLKTKQYRYPLVKSYFGGIKYKRQKMIFPPLLPASTKQTGKDILIVKTDSIGDYVLMRNFFKWIKQTKKYRDANITLILSSAMKDIAEYLDSDIIDTFLYVPHPFWRLSSAQQNQAFFKLFSKGLKHRYDSILFPSFNVSSFMNLNAMILSEIQASETIARVGDLSISNPDHMRFLSLFNQVVFNADGKNTFEFFNNKNFFETASGETMPLPLHTISLPKEQKSPYVVINPCAQDAFRMWHVQNYATVINTLIHHYRVPVYLIGTQSDKNTCDQLNALCDNRCHLMIGKSFKDIILLMNNATLFIGNDSACFHIAAALKTPAICISAGMSYGRFVHYPPSSLYRIVFHPDIQRLLEQFMQDKKNENQFCPIFGAINSVSVNRVMDAIYQLEVFHE